MSKYIAPEFKKNEFNCPFCGVYAKQNWNIILSRNDAGYSFSGNIALPYGYICRCDYCNKHSIWIDGKMIFPDSINVPMPNDDLSEGLKIDYLEAASIFEKSPRASAALLRLIIEKICDDFNCEGNNLKDKIGYLVKDKRLDSRVTKALDIIRIFGNDSVHAGEINLNDKREDALKLFSLVNFIAQKLITDEKELDRMCDMFSEGQKKTIEKRDKK